METEEDRAQRMITTIRMMQLHPKRCLDYGCGRGWLLRSLQVYHNAYAVGVEWQDVGADAVVKEIVETKEEVTGTFDLITCIRRLSSAEEIRWMAERLTPGGTILIEEETSWLKPILDRVGMPHLFIDQGKFSQSFIGSNYGESRAERVVETVELAREEGGVWYGR